MGATPAAGPTLGTRHPTPIRHIFTVTPRIAEELASTFTLDLHITAIDTADPDISIIRITAGMAIGRSRGPCLRKGRGPRKRLGGIIGLKRRPKKAHSDRKTAPALSNFR